MSHYPAAATSGQPSAHAVSMHQLDTLADQSDAGVGVRALADLLLQHLKLIVFVIALALLAGVAALMTAEPVYRASALLQISERTRAPAISNAAAGRSAGDESPLPLPGEVEILRSRDIVSQAIDQVRADTYVEVVNRFPLIGAWYARNVGHSGAGSVAEPPLDFLNNFAWGGERLSVASFDVPAAYWRHKFELQTVPTDTTQWLLRDEHGAEVARGAVGEPVRFQLGGEPSSLQIERMTANAATRFSLIKDGPMAAYENVLKSLRVSESTRQSGVVRLSYEHNDPKFAAALLNGITTSYLTHDVGRRTVEAERSLKFLDAQLPDVKKRLDQSEDALNDFRTRSNTFNVDQESDNLLRRSVDLERERVQLQLRYDQLSQRYEPSHPELLSLSRQLGHIAAELAKTSRDVNTLPRQQRDYLRLQREVQLNTQLYTSMLNNAQELRVARAGMVGNARLIDSAVATSKPISPQAVPILSVAAGIGLMLGIAAAALLRMMRPTVRDIEDIERQTGLPALASIPDSAQQRALMRRGLFPNNKPHRLLSLKSPDEPAVESLRGLRTSLALQGAAARNKAVLITAATTNVGKSFVACNLAVLMAAAQRRVLLIEADLRAPRDHLYFGLPVKHPGLVDALAKTHSLAEAIRPDVLPNLDVLLPGTLPTNPSELLLSPEFDLLMSQLKQSYDHIVIDSAPVLPVGDTLALGRVASASFVVVRADESSAREVRDALKRLRGANVAVDGLIFNGVKRGIGTQRYDRYFAPYRTA